MFLLGVNQIVGHGYPYSPAAAAEPGWSLYAAAAFNAHNPWFPVMPDVALYMQRMSWLLRQGKPANDIAILLPEDDAQAAFHPGQVSVTDEMHTRITPELMSAILDAGYNIDYIDAATIDKLKGIPYPVLILPEVTRIPLSAYKQVAAYAASSGKVIAIGKLPSLAPGLKEQNTSPEIAALSHEIFESGKHNGLQLESISQLADALHRALPPDVEATGQTAGLGFNHRRLSSSDVYFVVNSSNQPIDGAIRFRSTHTGIQSWNPDSGSVINNTQNTRGSTIPLQLAPYESRVFVLADDLTSAPTVKATPHNATRTQLADLSSGWQLHFAGSASAQTVDHPLSWTELEGRKYYSGEAVYSRNYSIEKPLASDARIFLDFGEGTPTTDNRPPQAPGVRALLDPPIREAAVVFVNGQRAGSLWHAPYRIEIASLLHPGENKIEVHVYNTAINELAGQPHYDYTALNAKYGKRFEPQDMDHLQPVPSGLLSPIHLEEERQ
jgi:hypothetical protein